MELLARIQEVLPDLPTHQKAIAEAILSHYVEMAFLSGNELAERVGVSNATVVRFAQRLGYAGYPEFQQELQKLVQTQLVPMKKLRDSLAGEAANDNILTRVLELDSQNLMQILSLGLDESFNRAVTLLAGCRRLFVVGLRSSYAIAYYLGFLLRQFMPAVRVLGPHTEDIFDQIIDLDARDCLLAISFARYTKRTVEIARFAKEVGTPVVCVTDYPTSPLIRYAATTLLVPNHTPHYSYVPAMSVANALVVALARVHREAGLERLKRQEVVLLREHVYE